MRISWKSFSLALVLSMLLVGVIGCGDSGEDTPRGTGGGLKSLTIDIGELPVLGGYVPPLGDQVPGLDEDRLKVPYPKGWTTGPRMGKVLVWFKQSKQHDYPQILVSAEDFDTVMNVNASTISEFLKALANQLRQKNPDVQVVSIRVGDRWGALYRRWGRVKGEFTETEVERLMVETVVEGRKYAFELRSYPGQTEKYAPYLYAVFSGTKFLKHGTTEKPPEKPAPESPPEQPPAKPETPPEKPKTEPAPEQPPPKTEPAPETPKETPKSEKPKPKESAVEKPPAEKPPTKPEPAEKPKKKKKPLDFEIE